MDIYVHADGGVDASLDLADWVARDPRVPADVARGSAAPAAGSMSATMEILQFAVGNGIALAGLLVSVARWRDGRPERPAVRISAQRPDGASITLESDDPQRIAEAVRQLGGA